MKRKLRRWLTGAVVVVLAYAGVALNPSLLFAHELRVENIVAHSRAPLPAQAEAMLREARARLAQSPWFDAGERYDVYFCGSSALFTFFLPWERNVGAASLTGLTGNVFVRPANIAADRLIGPRGTEVPGERTLTYFLAHELTHTAMARRLGRVTYHRLEVWQQEGIADVVGKAGAFDFEQERQRFLRGERELSPTESGLYLRYQLMVEALRREGESWDDIVRPGRTADEVEARLRR